MSDIEPKQKIVYDKWIEILKPKIDRIYPQMDNAESRKNNIQKLAQENARYMTSVFTPTKMGHTINLRQLNHLISKFENYYEENKNSESPLMNKIAQSMKDFVDQTKERWFIEGLQNQTDRDLSLFNSSKLEKNQVYSTTINEHFADSYVTSYKLSLAGLAQAHRHRTINYNILNGAELKAPLGVFIPRIIRYDSDLMREWKEDLYGIAETDYPQAQLVAVAERGIIEDFRSKALLRMCGHAQAEIMENTHETAKKYFQYIDTFGKNALKPKCQQGIKCPSNCVWTGKKALERLV